jgi:hypothetical protein
MQNSFENLLNQIDAFIRKYYKNELIKGSLLFGIILLFSFLLTTSIEFVGRFGSFTRGILLVSFISLNFFVLIKYFLIPLIRIYSFGRKINHLQAAEIIGKFFPEISDRLKNTLQLNNELEKNEGNIELLRASVSQRAQNLNVIPFTSAVNYNENKKYLKYILPLFLVFILIAIFIPSLITQGTKRVINYSEEYKELAPFQFVVNTDKLNIEEGEDAEILLILKGSVLPETVYLVCENGTFLMKKIARNSYQSWIKKPKNQKTFFFKANDFVSKNFVLNVTGKSVLGKLQATLSYPKYLGKLNEVVNNVTDLTVPEGTTISWSVLTKNTKSTQVAWNNQTTTYTSPGFKFSKTIMSDVSLRFKLSNSFKAKIDSSRHSIIALKDAFPSIQVSEQKDSVSDGVSFFNGEVSDDYGLKNLNFVYTLIHEDGTKKSTQISVRAVSGNQITFDFAVDFRREEVKLNDRIEYYFVVYDNDGVNGSKSSRTQTQTYRLPSLEELNDQRTEDQNQTKEDLSKLLGKTKEFQKNIEKLKKEVFNSKSNDWNKMDKMNQLKEEQKSLIESLEKAKDEMKQSVEEKNQLSETDKEILEKQEMIDKLLEELMDDELKKLLEELEKLMELNNKEEIKDKIDELKESSEDMKKQLDRSLEMLKKLQVNEKIDDIEKELQALAKEQEELKKAVEEKKESKESALKKQEEINKKFDDIKEDLQKLKDLNKELDKPMDLGAPELSEQQISDDLQDSKESLDEGQDKKAGEKQKSAADEMKELAEQLDQKQKAANKKQEEEDIDALRAILENLMTLSFDQEKLMFSFSRVKTGDPAYLQYGRRQRRIIDDTKLVKDSLLALAKRQPKIATFIDKELQAIFSNHSLAIENIDDRNKRELNQHQQLTMTSYNNLALLLNEALESMQSEMKADQPAGSCDNPGKGRPKPGSSPSQGDMKEMLKKQLEQMQKGMKEGGKKPGEKPGEGIGKKPGQGGEGGMGLGNKEIAKMAAEQTAIRQRLEELRSKLNKDGKGLGNKLNPLLKELEEQERSLINKNIDKETINRQKDILTRLLESEEALMERGFEEKRESKSGKDDNSGNKIRVDEYKKQKLNQLELLRSIDPAYRRYYKEKASQYFNEN